MTRGTPHPINKAMLRPMLIAGVEKRLALVNALLAFLLVAATHLSWPSCLVGVGFFMALHGMLVMISKHDPHLGKIIKRTSRYIQRPYLPARSHPLMLSLWKVKTVSRPW